MENKEYTTIQIYREDLATITSMCRKNENLRDRLHQIINNLNKKGGIDNGKDNNLAAK